MNKTRRRFTKAVACSALLGAMPAFAQAYPTRAVKIIVNAGPGTVADLLARMLGQHLGEMWGQGVVIENIAGAGGLLGNQSIAQSKPDGYTIGLVSSNFVMAPATYSKLAYDSINDFKPIQLLAYNTFAFVVHPSLPVKSLQDLIALAKEKPGTIDYGSSGNGGSLHLTVAMLAHMAGIKLTHIPYRSNGAAVTDILSGQIKLMANSESILAPHVQTGKLRALAVSGNRRSPVLPDVPTVAEAGVPGYEYKNWLGITAPAGMPEPIVAKLQAELTSIVKRPAFESQLRQWAVELELMGSDEFGKRISNEIAIWKRVVKESDIRVE